jgi:choline dehydrogenase
LGLTKITIVQNRAPGVEISIDRDVHRIEAGKEVAISLGAINTPKLLMQPGIGDQERLKAHGANVVQHLPEVGQNYQDHVFVAG